MDEFFKALLIGKSEKPDQIYIDGLLELCPEAKSIEWYIDGNIHEAIFVESGQEKVARFSDECKLIDLRINLHTEDIPEKIRKVLELHGEIMSSILIQEENNTKYEFVLRDKLMKREIIFTDKKGIILCRKDFSEII